MSKSSRKGDAREHEWANAIGGEKISRKGFEGADVESRSLYLLKGLRLWEVKSKEDLPDWLVGPDGWLGQMEREGADAVVFRQNRRPWYMIVQVDPTTELRGGAAFMQWTASTLAEVPSEELLEELARRLNQ